MVEVVYRILATYNEIKLKTHNVNDSFTNYFLKKYQALTSLKSNKTSKIINTYNNLNIYLYLLFNILQIFLIYYTLIVSTIHKSLILL